MAACRRDAFMSGRLTSLDGTPLRGESGPGGECGATPKEGATSGPHDAKRSTSTVPPRACVRAVPCRPHVAWSRRCTASARSGTDGIRSDTGEGRGARSSKFTCIKIVCHADSGPGSPVSMFARGSHRWTAHGAGQGQEGVQGQLSEASNVGRGRSRASLSSSSYVRFHE